jgi:hypothetical protein
MQASQTLFELVHYGHFTPEFVTLMKPFEREFHIERTKEAKKAEDDLNIVLHDKKRA